MTVKKDKTQNQQHDKIRRAYHPPSLFIYGGLQELTAGGSGGRRESGRPMGKGQSGKQRP